MANSWHTEIGRFAANQNQAALQARLQAMVDAVPADATDDEIDAVLDEMSRLVADALDSAAAMATSRAVQFANPWHDEIGRFAPKGSGSTSGGYQDKPRSDNGKPPDYHDRPHGEGERGRGSDDPNTSEDWHDKKGDDSPPVEQPAGRQPPEPPLERGSDDPWQNAPRRNDPAFPDRVVRVLNETVAAGASPRVRDRLKKWGERIAKTVGTGPAVDNPVFPWLRP